MENGSSFRMRGFGRSFPIFLAEDSDRTGPLYVRSFSCLNRLRDVDCSIWNLKIWRFSMEFPAERL